MKKFLVLLLVLGIATAANAEVVGLVFTVNGLPQPPEITIGPSQSIEIDLEIAASHTNSDYTLNYDLYAPGTDIPTQLAEFVTTGAAFPNASSYMFGSGFAGPRTSVHFQISGSNFGIPINGPAIIMNGILIHCIGPGDVLLKIVCQGGTKVDGQDVPFGTIMHTLLIHQIPEPATLMLLGLGSLFLARRKK